jgi:very-short-patch-repair endonuclease
MDLSLITRQGIFATADAHTIGLTDNDLRHLVATGVCVRLTHGWYAPTTGPITPLERHRLTSLALGRQYCGKAALSHYSSLIIADIATYAVDLDLVHLTQGARPKPTPSGREDLPGQGAPRPKPAGVSSRRKGLVLHRPLGTVWFPPPTQGPGVWDTPASVPTAWAVVQTGLAAGGLSSLVSADSALHSDKLTREDLTSAVELFRRHPGISKVRAALAHVDPRHESPGETRTAHVLRHLGFAIEPQVEIDAEGRRYRADFRIVGTRVLVEFDGAVKYGDDRRVLFDEKRREDALRRQGWVIVRIVWADLDDAALVRRRVRDALKLANNA